MACVLSPSRWKGPLLAVLCLLGGLVATDLAVSAALGWDAFRKETQESQTYSRLELASSKAVALAALVRRGQSIGIAYGMSTTEQGIQLRSLEKLDGVTRWAKVTGEHASLVNLLEVARRVDAEAVHPAKTLLCLHYGMLVGAQRFPGSRTEQLSRVLSRADHLNTFGEASRALSLSWLGNNRQATVNALEARLGLARERLLRLSEQGSTVIHPPVDDPFADVPNTRTARARAAWEGRLQLVKRRGWDRAASYRPDGVQGRALTELVEVLGSRSDLVIVLLPERAALRELVPERAASLALQGAIGAARVREPPPVLDLRAALPDDEFVDEAHPTGRGSDRLAGILSEALAKATMWAH